MHLTVVLRHMKKEETEWDIGAADDLACGARGATLPTDVPKDEGDAGAIPPGPPKCCAGGNTNPSRHRLQLAEAIISSQGKSQLWKK